MDARAITAHLHGRWHGGYGVSPCPVCQTEARRDQTALTIADTTAGRLLLNCKRLNCAFVDILSAAGIGPLDYTPPDPLTLAQREAEKKAEAAKRANQARICWGETLPLHGTPAETYLRARGISCALPESLRFHQACWHGATASRLPAMVARVDGGEGFAVHRTYLRADGSSKADVTPAKAMLGAVSGGTVRLTSRQGPLVVAEGIETALSLASGLLSEPASFCAALSTSGIRGLRLPRRASRLIIATDGDVAGRVAGEALAERAHACGWQVSLLPAPQGKDWNDVLTGKEVATC